VRKAVEKIRVLIGMLGLDQHELGAIVVSKLLRDAGMEVIYSGKFNIPAKLLKASIEEDADVIGLSCHSWEYLHYVPQLLELMREKGLEIPLVIGGSVVTPADAESLSKLGVAAAFGPGAAKQEIVQTIRRIASGAA
jgi:methylmalonyl-CoA mutase C-terminal domain/subunit